MKNAYVIGVDMGTGGVRAVLFDLQGRTVSEAYRETETIIAAPGRAEQDPHAVLDNAYEVVATCVRESGVPAEEIRAISFSSFQASFAMIDRSENFLGNLILWQDFRGTEMFPWIHEKLSEAGLTAHKLYRRTGQPLNVIPSGPRVFWIKERMPELYEKVYRFVTPQSMLVRAFGGEDWYDESCNGSLWLTNSCEGYAPDKELIRAFGADADKIPPMAAPGTPAGKIPLAVAERTGLKVGTPLFVGSADQMCAALGVGNYGTPDIASLSLGTAGILLAYSPTAVRSERETYHIVGFPGGGYSLEGAAPVAALGLRWLRDMLYPAELFSREDVYNRMTAEAETSPVGANGVICLPHLAGTVSPVNDGSMRGTFAGMNLGTSRADLIRAMMEGVCFEMREMIEAYREVGAGQFTSLRALGGAANSPFWNQMQADVYGCRVETMEAREVSALGAGMLAAVGAGLYGSFEEACRNMTRVRSAYEPDAARKKAYDKYYSAYVKVMESLRGEAYPHLQRVLAGEV